VKKLLLSLLAAGAMSIPASALALPTQAPFYVHIVNGAYDIPVGTMLFDLDSDVTGVVTNPILRACRYYVEWDNYALMPISADGFVLETKAHGAASCLQNSYFPVHTLVQADYTYPFYGFDRFQQFRPVAVFMLAEDGDLSGPVEITGLVGFGGAVGISPPSTMLNSIELDMGP
jgi:hypothetical protein